MPRGVGGDAPLILSVLWALRSITFIPVVLHLYTRIKVVNTYGMDDRFYNTDFIFYNVYDIMVQISATFSFGMDVTKITLEDDVPQAILYEATGQTLSVIGIVIAKYLVDLFILRIVTTGVIAIWVPAVIFGIPAAVSLLDHRIDSHCNIDPRRISVHEGACSVVIEFWYAGLPWYLLWKLSMPRREKLVIASSMSCGPVATAYGTKRAAELYKLGSPNYHQAVNMFGVDIPIYLPFTDIGIEINAINMNTFRIIEGTIYSNNKVASAGNVSEDIRSFRCR
ncbi:hypothetical protein F5X99DRAFT_422513 [Biscogniauxia marginata]|nr:hypothetical protein F5X99DRAFT_422513 [Biscogniauxia marginata]